MAEKIRVMLVDDSAVIRGLFERALLADGNIEIVATASNGQIAISTLKNLAIDVMILDVEMPVMNGIEALPDLLKLAPKMRIIMASTLTKRNAEISLQAMQLGASDYIAKPSSREVGEVGEFYLALISKIKALAPHIITTNKPVVSLPGAQAAAFAAGAASSVLFSPIISPSVPVRQSANAAPAQALGIACSTGGPQALLSIFRDFKGAKLRVPIFITQHMPPNFTTILADHISKASGMDCHEAVDGEEVVAGKIYVAPGDFHMVVKRVGTSCRLQLNQDPAENFCRPSADPMFRSLAKAYGDKLLTAVLTGLGADGARGASEVVAAGGVVMAQDEASCVVYGMPKAAVEAKLTSAVLPLNHIAPYLLRAVT